MTQVVQHIPESSTTSFVRERDVTGNANSWMANLLIAVTGFLFVAAGTLKWTSVFTGTELTFWEHAIALFDLVIGYSLCAFPHRRMILASGGILMGLAMYNVAQIAMNRTSCGCFGDIVVSPTTMAIVDSCLGLGMLAVGWFRIVGQQAFTLPAGISLAVGSVLFAIFSDSLAGPIDYTLRLSEGEVVSAVYFPTGHQQKWTIVAENPGNAQVHLIGWNSNCASFKLDSDLPITLAPGESKPIRVSYSLSPQGATREQIEQAKVTFGKNRKEALNWSSVSQLNLLCHNGGSIAATVKHRIVLSPMLLDVIFDNEKER